MEEKSDSSEVIPIQDYYKTLMKAIKSKNNEVIIDILPKIYVNNDDSFKDFRDYYKKVNHETVMADINKAYEGNFKILLLALFTEPIEYDCYQLGKATERRGNYKETLIEILSTRSPETIGKIKEKYETVFIDSCILLEDVEQVTSGYFRKFLTSLIESEDVKDKYQSCDQMNLAKELVEGNYDRWGTQDEFFLNLFTKTSKNDFKKIMYYCSQELGETPFWIIHKSYPNSYIKDLLMNIYLERTDPTRLFAELIHDSLLEKTIDYNLITRLIVTQRNKGIEHIRDIMKSYTNEFKANMIKDIKKKTKGSYRKLICSLLQ